MTIDRRSDSNVYQCLGVDFEVRGMQSIYQIDVEIQLGATLALAIFGVLYDRPTGRIFLLQGEKELPVMVEVEVDQVIMMGQSLSSLLNLVDVLMMQM